MLQVLNEQFESQVRVHFLLSRMEQFDPSPFAVVKEQFESQVRVYFLLFSPKEHSLPNERVYWGVLIPLKIVISNNLIPL